MEVKFYSTNNKIIPANDETYQALCKLGCMSTRLDIAILPLLREALKLKGVEVVLTPISTLFDSYYKTTERYWAEKFTIKDDRVFVLSGKNTQDTKDRLIKLEHQWRKVFNRYGYTGDFKYDETATRLKMTISFEESETLPEIHIENAEKITDAALKIDDCLLTLHRDGDSTTLSIMTQCSSSKPIVHTYSANSVKDDGFIAALISMIK